MFLSFPLWVKTRDTESSLMLFVTLPQACHRVKTYKKGKCNSLIKENYGLEKHSGNFLK